MLIAMPLISLASAFNVSSPHESNPPRVRSAESQLLTAESNTSAPSRPITTRYTFDDDSIASSRITRACATLFLITQNRLPSLCRGGKGQLAPVILIRHKLECDR